jgi:hypothetical protein
LSFVRGDVELLHILHLDLGSRMILLEGLSEGGDEFIEKNGFPAGIH